MSESIATHKPGTLRGWRWFCYPVVLTVIYHLAATFDYDYAANVERCFSVPYFVVAVVIGIRRGNRLTLPDFLFLVFGDFLIVTLLWHVNPSVRH